MPIKLYIYNILNNINRAYHGQKIFFFSRTIVSASTITVIRGSHYSRKNTYLI